MTKQKKTKTIKSKKEQVKEVSKDKIGKSIKINFEGNNPNATINNQETIENTNIEKGINKRDIRIPASGTIITRKYKWQEIKVKVLDESFEYQGKIYKSISSLAVAIAGYPISGYVFFRLGNKNAR